MESENRGTIIKFRLNLYFQGHVTKLTRSFPSKIELLLFEHPNVAGLEDLTDTQHIKLFLESFKNSTSKDNIIIAKKNPARLSELKKLHPFGAKAFKSNSKEGGMKFGT